MLELSVLRKYVEGKTVSFVGSASSIMSHEGGEAIDSRDVVLRSNIEKVINPDLYKHIGKRTDVAYCNNDIYARFTNNGVHVIGVPAIVQSKPWSYSSEVQERYGELSPNEGRVWCPMSGITGVYTCLVEGAKEVYVAGFDFYKSNNWQGRHFIFADGPRRIRLQSGNWNDVEKDELAFRQMIKDGYNIKMDKVLEGIING